MTFQVIFSEFHLVINGLQLAIKSTDKTESKTKECANFKFEVKSCVK